MKFITNDINFLRGKKKTPTFKVGVFYFKFTILLVKLISVRKLIILLFLFFVYKTQSQQIATLKYKGGGDWYSNPTALPNLINFVNSSTKCGINKEPQTVSLNDNAIFNYPIVFMTGHGNVYFDDEDVRKLKNYLISGGFLHISDNYGLDKYIRKELSKVFPKEELTEIPINHPIYHQTYDFPNGLPKIHEHDKKEPKGLGIFYKSRLVVFYDHESDLSDGWEDQSIHNDPKEIREKALKMGSNIIEYAFTN
ncbi:protein of unknown function [Tenacibaculum sp. MAR_2009_124]|nr:protein of unknown function [Tenacibaculum sp. MAR_2009_124]